MDKKGRHLPAFFTVLFETGLFEKAGGPSQLTSGS
ncbi:hypothetical protein PB2503_07212 [Parvularcula bermudensis HTCC2503]|uniref:Uncharacterized protein n=1 Tax=Parvularcula bermudensis (strain ATCC BAA-594 / HTCC2503 / KCTC 12087) TaxID=314260 RepID=E0TET6_PARBH|nr:hypothetical protein PB2503_07212 [Parvularcula bermudensis HTCC2503]